VFGTVHAPLFHPLIAAKEFVTARDDEQGVLVLSRFTGAARELADAVQINPFDLDEQGDGLHSALSLSADDQRRRMRRMRAQVEDHNIYRWAGMLLSEVSKLVQDPAESEPDVDDVASILPALACPTFRTVSWRA